MKDLGILDRPIVIPDECVRGKLEKLRRLGVDPTPVKVVDLDGNEVVGYLFPRVKKNDFKRLHDLIAVLEVAGVRQIMDIKACSLGKEPAAIILKKKQPGLIDL